MKCFSNISDLKYLKTFEDLVGPIVNLEISLLSDIGFSASTMEKIVVEKRSGEKQNFILKQTHLSEDWLSGRTHDTLGREAAQLNEPCLSKIWKSFHCPYFACAMEPGRIAMLMEDLSAYLFPDVKEAIDLKTEESILQNLAAIHASYWESPEIKKLGFLVKPHQYLEFLGPGKHDSDLTSLPPEPLSGNMKRGWAIALEQLPAGIKSLILQPAEKMMEQWKGLPFTLLHGDSKIANMAKMPDGKIAAFDFAAIGYGPCGIELGWYIAVNSTRLARSKEEVISLYRNNLEAQLQHPIDEKIWKSMRNLALVTGARMMLWSKALALQSGTVRGKDEWDWWVQELQTTNENLIKI